MRAIAALSVLFSHTTLELDSFGLNSRVFGNYPDGNPMTTLLAGFGVSIFFALSGFLITYLLLEEKRLQEIDIKSFYIRRILRIWPLYYLYMALSLLTNWLFDLPFEGSILIFYVFLLANVPFILGTAIPILGHYWSLGVEEQFYSFWPWVVKKSRFILVVTLALCLLLIGFKCAIRFLGNQQESDFKILYSALNTTRFQCMLIGALGAILYFRRNALFLKLVNNYFVQALSWIVIALVAFNRFHVLSILDNEIISLVTVFLIIGQITEKHRLVNLDLRFFDFIGKISYGIYVIHPLVIFYLSRFLFFTNKNLVLNYVLVYGAVILLTLGVSYLSYEFFEKRFLRMKEKYTAIKSSGSALLEKQP